METRNEQLMRESLRTPNLEWQLRFAAPFVRPVRVAPILTASITPHVYGHHEGGSLGAIVEEHALYFSPAAIVKRAKFRRG